MRRYFVRFSMRMSQIPETVKEAALMEFAPLAQLVEQLTLNQWVPGSNP